MPTLNGTEASLSYVQCFLYLVSFSINVSCFSYYMARMSIFLLRIFAFTVAAILDTCGGRSGWQLGIPVINFKNMWGMVSLKLQKSHIYIYILWFLNFIFDNLSSCLTLLTFVSRII